jgi:hypothetical protein
MTKYMAGIIVYDKDHQFTQDELAPLIPANVTRWMCQQAYGTPEPGNPLMFWKKAISFFMPNWLMPWNAISGQGNLTRSTEVSNMIKKII